MKYDRSKYEVSEQMPENFAQVIPGLGIQHFSREHLKDNDLKALLMANNPWVKAAGVEYTEDAPAEDTPKKRKEAKPEYKDIGAGTFPQ